MPPPSLIAEAIIFSSFVRILRATRGATGGDFDEPIMEKRQLITYTAKELIANLTG